MFWSTMGVMTWDAWWIIAHRVQRRLLQMSQTLDNIELQNEGKGSQMVDPKVAKLIEEFDAATNAIAARIQALIDGGGLNAESEAALQGEVDKLTALGKDPEAPVPAA